MNDLKEYITTNLLRKDGRLNSAIFRREWFLTSKEFTEIVQITNFLNKDVTISERIYCIMNDVSIIELCPICKINFRTFLPNFGKGYSKTCSDKKCIASHGDTIKKRLNTNNDKYGANVSQTMLDALALRQKDMNQKSKKAIQEKYGVGNAGQLINHSQKVKATNMRRYGTDCWMNSDVAKEITKENKLNRFVNCTLVKEPSSDITRLYPNATDYYTFICDVCKNEDNIAYYTAKWRLTHFNTTCSKCSNLRYGSKFQLQVYDFIKNFVECQQNVHPLIINKQEVDVYCEGKKIAFECNGLYWHSAEHFQSQNKEANKDYLKYELFKSNGIRIYSIMEDEWIHKPDIVKSRIKNIFGLTDRRIYARKCITRLIDRNLVRDFCELNHIQGYHGCSMAYGLIYEDELVSVMTFTNSNITRKLKNTWEISRFCSLLNTSVIGGAGKLFTRFLDDVKPELVVSYADTRWSDGNLYKQLGFTFEHQTSCNYWYVDKKNIKRIHRFNLRKKPDEPKDKTEFELRQSQGYLKIYDYGSSKWIWRK